MDMPGRRRRTGIYYGVKRLLHNIPARQKKESRVPGFKGSSGCFLKISY